MVGIGKQGKRKRIVRAEWVLYKHYERTWPWLVLHNHWGRNVNTEINDAKWNQSKQSNHSHAIPPTAEPLCIPICAKIVSLTYNKSHEGCLWSTFKWKHKRVSLHNPYIGSSLKKQHSKSIQNHIAKLKLIHNCLWFTKKISDLQESFALELDF